jgi:hypothetical protein
MLARCLVGGPTQARSTRSEFDERGTAEPLSRWIAGEYFIARKGAWVA